MIDTIMYGSSFLSGIIHLLGKAELMASGDHYQQNKQD
jgi:hypothetical protein